MIAADASNAVTEGLAIRPMTERDLPAVVALDRASHLTPWSDENFDEALAAGNLCFVAERAGAIVGCAVLQAAGGDADLLTMAVTPSARRGGIGRRLLRELVARAAAYGATAVFLEVRESNAAAIALYRDAGFTAIGVRKGYYEGGNGPDGRDGRENAITMRLDAAPGKAEAR